MTALSRKRLSAVFAALLPGILAGTQIAGLLFFLNPHLPFDLVPVLRGIGFFSLLLGTVSLSLLLPFLWRRPERAHRWMPWSLIVVLAVSALGAWFHASYYAFFLPSGINRRLVKAGIWLSLAAVVCFYTALIHQLRQRKYGPRSRILFALMAMASIYVVMERREAFKPNLGPGPRATTFEGSSRPQLLVVGIEAATLDAILPLAEHGQLPFFNKILTEGSRARLTSLVPVRRKALWTTLASGKYPFRHGIVSEQVVPARFLGNREILSLLPVGIGFEYWGTWNTARAIDSGSLRVLTLWEILARLDISSALIGWPVSTPKPGTEPADSVKVGLTERFFEGADIDVNDRVAWPAEITERARLFQTQRGDLASDQVSRFGSNPPAVVLDALTRDLWREDLTLFLLDQDPQIDAFFLVLPGLSEISKSYFGAYSAVQFEGKQDPASKAGSQLVAAYYTHVDEFLARLWSKTREPHLLAVVSVQGAEGTYGWRKAWQVLRRQPPMRGYIEQGPAGVLMLLGDGIRPELRSDTSDLVDLVPTLLYGMGFPIARDLDGAVLTSAFETNFLARHPLTLLPSYETFAPPEEPLNASWPEASGSLSSDQRP